MYDMHFFISGKRLKITIFSVFMFIFQQTLFQNVGKKVISFFTWEPMYCLSIFKILVSEKLHDFFSLQTE